MSQADKRGLQDPYEEMPGKRAPFVVFGGILLIAICTVTVAIVGYIRGGGEFLTPEPAHEVHPGTDIYKDPVGTK